MISISFQKSTAQNPEQPDLTLELDLLEQRMGPGDLQRSTLTEMFL